jgi:hypothetical protein
LGQRPGRHGDEHAQQQHQCPRHRVIQGGPPVPTAIRRGRLINASAPPPPRPAIRTHAVVMSES